MNGQDTEPAIKYCDNRMPILEYNSSLSCTSMSHAVPYEHARDEWHCSWGMMQYILGG